MILKLYPLTTWIARSGPPLNKGGMDRPTVIPVHTGESLSEEARAVIGALIIGFEEQLADLKQHVQDLKARLDQNSTNSSKSPSTDPIGVKRKPPTPPSKKRRGGQKGHPRRMRALVPPERVASVTDCKPTECRRCGHSLSGEDAEPRRHQVAELPPIEQEVHEYRLHRLCCPHCHTVTGGGCRGRRGFTKSGQRAATGSASVR
jgi:transposase